MRRYVFSEAFSAIAHAAYAKATGDENYAEGARQDFATYLKHSFEKGLMQPKIEANAWPLMRSGLPGCMPIRDFLGARRSVFAA
jgi:N-acylglucosamine 2-epimerase